jgi:hypothetical protein
MSAREILRQRLRRQGATAPLVRERLRLAALAEELEALDRAYVEAEAYALAHGCPDPWCEDEDACVLRAWGL